MHSNLKNTITKMDDQITQFAKGYVQEQAKAATKISKIVEAVTSPIANKI